MRVSVTDIEQLAYYRRTEDMPLADLLRRLRREDPPSPQMAVGTAFHAFLEHAGECEVDTVEQDGFIFDFSNLDAEIALPEIRELKVEREIVDGVTVVGKVDAAEGKRVEDHKTSNRFDPERYQDSIQWKAYLTLLEANEFIYNVFVIYAPTKAMPDNLYRVMEFHRLPLYRYPGMDEDVRRAVTEYRDFARRYLEAA